MSRITKRQAIAGGILAALVLVAGWFLLTENRGKSHEASTQDRLTDASPAELTESPPQRTESAPATRIRPRKAIDDFDSLGGSVTGDVQDAVGDPIPRAVVWIVAPPGSEMANLQTTADEAGRFVFDGVPFRDWFQVRARAEGHHEGQEYVTVSQERPRATAHFRLWDAGTIRGRVSDAVSAEPISGAQVCAAYNSARVFGFDAQAEVTTGADGRFELRGVPLGVIVVRAVAPGYLMRGMTVRLASEAEAEIELSPGPGVGLTVAVIGLDDAGLKAAGVTVIAYDSGGAQTLPSSLLRGRLDADGKWSASGLPDYEFLVWVHADGWSFEPRERRAQPGGGPHSLSFKAIRDGEVMIKGTLKDESGRPLPGETILGRASNGGRRATAKTSPDGSFSLTSPLAKGERIVFYLVGSRYVLHQEKDPADFNSMDMRSRAKHEARVDPATPLNLVAVLKCRVLGRVVSQNGPVPGVEAVLEHGMSRRSPRWMAFSWTSTDADGNFVFEGLHVADDELRVSVADQAGAGFSRSFQLVAGRDLEGVDVVLASPSIVEGTVRGLDGEPAPGARVWLMGRDEESRSQQRGNINEVLADRKGRFRFLGVGPGEHTLSALFEGHHPVAQVEKIQSFRVEPGARVEQDVVVR